MNIENQIKARLIEDLIATSNRIQMARGRINGANHQSTIEIFQAKSVDELSLMLDLSKLQEEQFREAKKPVIRILDRSRFVAV